MQSLLLSLSGAEKLGISKDGVIAVDEADGTEIDDYEMLVDLSSSSSVIIILLEPGQTWTKCSAGVDEADEPGHLAPTDEARASTDSLLVEKGAALSAASSESKPAKKSEWQKYPATVNDVPVKMVRECHQYQMLKDLCSRKIFQNLASTSPCEQLFLMDLYLFALT